MTSLSVSFINKFSGHRDGIYSLAQGGTNKIFYSTGGDGMIAQWDLNAGTDGQLICKLDSPVYSICYLKESDKLILGSSKGNLFVVDLREKKEEKNLIAHAQSVFDILHVPARKLIITSGFDGTLIFWESTSYKIFSRLNLSGKSARCMSLHPNGKHLAVGFSDHSIRIINLDNFQTIATLKEHTNSVFSVVYSPDGRFLLSGGRDVTLKIWDVENSYELVKTITAHLLHINSIVYNFGGSLIATGSMDKSIKIWDALNFNLLKVIEKSKMEMHTSSVNKLLWMDDSTLISASDDKTLMAFKIEIK